MSQRDIIAIGGSLGAVEAVKNLFRDLPPGIDATILIVIHVGTVGNNYLADIFDEEASIPVTMARDGEKLKRGHAYVAPADHHLLVMGNHIRLGRGPRENMARPAIDPLFRSIAVSHGSRTVAVVLTGLLNDGAAGLADVKRCGGVTVVQNPREATAPQMPLEALKTGYVDYIIPLEELGNLLKKLTKEEAGQSNEIPEGLLFEVEIALGYKTGIKKNAKIADVVPLSCPACGGVLSQLKIGLPLRFRCQTGHAYTAETLINVKEGAVDEALRVALRMIEERVFLCEKMAEDARRSDRHAAAKIAEERMQEYKDYADLLRRTLLGKNY
ncbi:chemotaxis protein CheB [Beijerinckia indica]|uniref:protein-glutamate methylesterase n=1 Tax=Beijerinckia indica subsp. indica (strain ATCC 9039 / DSM 1715 / NCIMB 8712) TaxID=395963 RepID=B2ILH1_BEII9|nr:chemotaxis protein CheB [Beijerinckia indica]ACB97369.1 CheB methylesterase [Beijerinckia indica subsp. indica ATCC 9039]